MFMVRWQEEMAVRVKHLDDQHRRILRLLNAVARVRENGDSADMRAKLADLLLSLQIHHAAEEQVLTRYGYEALGSHRTAHQRLQFTLDALASGAGAIPEPLWERMLSGWRDALIRHLRVDDGHGYAAFLRTIVDRERGSPL